jgi:Zn-dependent protease
MRFQNIFGPAPAFGTTNDNVELLKAWAGTSLAYAIARLGGQIFNERFVSQLLIAALTAGVGILLHELAHRVVARGYGARAHFIANNAWLVLSIVVAFGGFFIAAPGAVWHTGTRSVQQGGLIAVAGPATNIVLALLFLIAAFVVPPFGFLAQLCAVGYSINAFLAFFNMLPFGPFDGAKVFAWNKIVWGAVIGLSLLMTFVLPRFL